MSINDTTSAPNKNLDSIAVDMNGWPSWPMSTRSSVDRLSQVLTSGRWSISGYATVSSPMERQFAEAFASWNGAAYCTPTANGTSALVAALEALGIGPGDEVIVPGLTWVAPAVAVLHVGATPVLADIDANTLSIAATAIEAATTDRTRAVIAVHLYCSVADLDAIVPLCEDRGISLIEDCAQSHGTEWRERKVGTFGAIGIFSMHQGKLLTSGEGGAAITDDPILYDKLEQLRSNGRRFATPPPKPGHLDLAEVGTMLGWNCALSEFQAALLLDGLERLETLNTQRARGAHYLDEALSSVTGLRPIDRPSAVTSQSYYHYLIRFTPEAFAHKSPEILAEWLSDTLGCPWLPIYPPMNANRLYAPHLHRRFAPDPARRRLLDPSRFELPVVEEACATSLITPHRILLAPESQLSRIVDAFHTLQRIASTL